MMNSYLYGNPPHPDDPYSCTELQGTVGNSSGSTLLPDVDLMTRYFNDKYRITQTGRLRRIGNGKIISPVSEWNINLYREGCVYLYAFKC